MDTSGPALYALLSNFPVEPDAGDHEAYWQTLRAAYRVVDDVSKRCEIEIILTPASELSGMLDVAKDPIFSRAAAAKQDAAEPPRLYRSGNLVPVDLELVPLVDIASVQGWLQEQPRASTFYPKLAYQTLLLNNAATLMERALIELSLRKAFYDMAATGTLLPGRWYAMAGNRAVASHQSREEAVALAKKAAPDSYFIVRQASDRVLPPSPSRPQ